jgi:hypothetical protein
MDNSDLIVMNASEAELSSRTERSDTGTAMVRAGGVVGQLEF